MKRWHIIFILVGLLGILVAIDYWKYSSKIINAQEFTDSIMRASEENLIRSKDSLIARLNKDSELTNKLNKKFDPKTAAKTRHKTVNTVLFDKTVEYTVYSQSYIYCLLEISKIEKHNDSILNKLNKGVSNLRTTYGEYVDEWFNRIGRNKFIRKRNVIDTDCNNYFSNNIKMQLLDESLAEFESFIKQLRHDKFRAHKSEERSLKKYKRYLRIGQGELNNVGVKYFTNNFSKYSSINDNNKYFTYRGDVLGQINYELTFSEFKDDYYYDVMEQAKIEQYRNNSLKTGVMPYGYCFGFDNSCEGWGCSKIRIITSLFDDLIITIKRNDEVVRHSYIEEGDSYTFYVPNGTYQTFFYSGSGWHPDKFMKYASCGELEGGFIDNENVGKDDPQYLNNQVLTYELRLQRNGNFSQEPSNINEAF